MGEAIRLRGVIVTALIAGVGCIEAPGVARPLPSDEMELFSSEAEPVLETRCAEAACHGDEMRPLRIYAPGHLRMDSSLVSTDDLTPDELERNYLQTLGFLVGISDPQRSQLLSKPLPLSDGGTYHEPGPVFESRIDGDFVALETWALDVLDNGGAP